MKIKSLIEKLSSYSTTTVVSVGTLFVLICSIILVYFVTKLVGKEYNSFLLSLSVLLPLFLTPITLYFVVQLSYKLSSVQNHLNKEIRKRQEQEVLLFEQARFILMGEMMANISHQWKQPLNTINLAILNLKLSNSNFQEGEKYLDIIEQNTNFLAETINDFSSFFDKRTHKDMKSFSQIIKEINSIIGMMYKKEGIRLDFDIQIKEEFLLAASLVQVILNLLNNAKDALQGQKDKVVKISVKLEENKIAIYCCDNGSGISKENAEKVFMPYFTTKEVKSGAGIGLYMSREIIEKTFNGELKLCSKQYANKKDFKTCFIIKIPESEMCTIGKGKE